MFNIKCNAQIIIDKKNAWIAKIKQKEKISVETINAFGARFNSLEELMLLIENKNGKTHHHPLTGPIYIENAKPGDVIKVHIHKIHTQEMAQSMSKTAGIMPIKATNLEARSPVIGKKCGKSNILYSHEIKLNYEPMIGIIATTPKEGMIKTGHAKVKNGGNLDLPFVKEDNSVYLPVEIEGAGLYLGDVHSLQGYGELSGIAMEASSNIILEVEVLKPRKKLENIFIIGKEPFSEKECIGLVGIGEKMKIENSIRDAFIGSYKMVCQLIPSMPKNMVKSLITLIGNSFNGQAFSKTSESTSIIVITKEDIEKITKNKYQNLEELEKVLFYSQN